MGCDWCFVLIASLILIVCAQWCIQTAEYSHGYQHLIKTILFKWFIIPCLLGQFVGQFGGYNIALG